MCHVIIQQSHQSRRKLSFFLHSGSNSSSLSTLEQLGQLLSCRLEYLLPSNQKKEKNKPCVYILNLTNTNQYYTVCFGCIKDSYIPDQTDTLPSLSICNFLSTKNFKAKKFHKVSSCKNGISNLKYGKAILGKIFGNIFFKFLFGE